MIELPRRARLRTRQGGHVDRDRTLTFRFDGRELAGHPGDTLASALLAAGVRIVGRSFKYHRPRGIYTAGPEEPNALAGIGTGARYTPNSKMTTVACTGCGRKPELLAVAGARRDASTGPCRASCRPATTRPSCGRRPSGRSTSP
jgi:hypothetical protein